MKEKTIVISGLGVASSIGSQLSDFSQNLFESMSCYKNHKLLPDSQEAIHRVAYVNDEHTFEGINLRIKRKLDRFSMLAMHAFTQAYNQAKLIPKSAFPMGILLGNSTGGWSYVEPQMDAIYSGDFDAISPYVATAWFPTAPQGEISIENKISGYSKTFSAGSLSAGYALEHALYLIKNDYLPGAFVGGVESPLSPLVYNACVHKGHISLSGKYLPYHNESDGYLLGEGASIAVVETMETCLQRKACPSAQISGVGIAATLSEAISQCLNEAQKKPTEVDVILLDAKAEYSRDKNELIQLRTIFSTLSNSSLCTSKTCYGYLVAADFAFQLLVGVLILQKQDLPKTFLANGGYLEDECYNVIQQKIKHQNIKNVLLYSIDDSGHSISVLIEAL